MLLTDAQSMLRESADGFIADRGGPAMVRALRDADDPLGLSRPLWQAFGEMGFGAILVPEHCGGLALGQIEAGLVLEALGRSLTPSPFLVSGVVGATLLAAAGSPAANAWLGRIAAGEALVTCAFDETRRHRPDHVELQAEPVNGGFRLRGRKTAIPFGHAADLVLASARLPAGIALFAIDGALASPSAAPNRLADASVVADLSFDETELPAGALLIPPGAAWPAIETALESGRLGGAAELVGIAAAAFALTLVYLKERRQFDRPIGSFQALQHRAAILSIEIEQARAVVRKAQRQRDLGDPEAGSLIAAARYKACTASRLAVQEGVQLHGGIGMTDEHAIGLYMKRQRVLEAMFGDADFQLETLARLGGY